MNRSRILRVPRGVEVRDLAFETTTLGASVVRGVLWPSGERFAATFRAISGRPGVDRILQVIYTDRGAFRTPYDAYEIGTMMAGTPEQRSL